ncbi:2-amino-4-hydroxy-6-hydroxymethyldihydropteridine diphosphokinase [Celeribacter marinus]|uniref:2-amino-4-hydroxy-6- hydroxymethyldihydropteridine diphosphokinase n=1 Tax=Celeribacter marinus TaxID=1397108 RepID=UPI00317CAFD8
MRDKNQRQNAYIALGGNLASDFGAPEDTLRAALNALSGAGVSVVSVSALYRTDCFPKGAGPDFVNACAHIESPFGAEPLLQILHEIEAAFGRTREVRWAGRPLDIDLIAMGAEVCPTPEIVRGWMGLPIDQQMKTAPDQLILPHPRLHERGFVLIPLRDVAPDWIHPLLGKTVTQMCDELPESERSGVKPL